MLNPLEKTDSYLELKCHVFPKKMKCLMDMKDKNCTYRIAAYRSDKSLTINQTFKLYRQRNSRTSLIIEYLRYYICN